MVGAALLFLLGGCAGDVPTANDCKRAFIATCSHQVSCDLAFDAQSCEIELDEQFICDYGKTKDEFKACANATDTPCTEFMDEACFEVMCSKLIGCVETTAGDTSDELQ